MTVKHVTKTVTNINTKNRNRYQIIFITDTEHIIYRKHKKIIYKYSHKFLLYNMYNNYLLLPVLNTHKLYSLIELCHIYTRQQT